MVDKIDNLNQSLSPLLIGLGNKHTSYTGFIRDYFNGYEYAMLNVWSEELGTKLD